MADNNKPLFAKTPYFQMVQIDTANTNRDGTGDVGMLFTASKKTQISEIGLKAAETTAAGLVRFFITDTDGNNPMLLFELSIAATSASDIIQCAENVRYFENFVISSGQIITCSTSQSKKINCYIQAGALED